MSKGKINFKLITEEIVNGSKWKVFVDGRYVGSVESERDLYVVVTKGMHRVKLKDDKQWTDAMEVCVDEDDARVEYVLGENNNSFRVIDACGCQEKTVQLTEINTNNKVKNGKTSTVLLWLTCIGIAFVAIYGIFIDNKTEKEQDNLTVAEEKTDNEQLVSASDKIEKEISEFINSYNKFYKKNLVNDDDAAYEMVLDSLHLEANYFKQYEYDENVYVAKYYSDGVDLYTIMLYMNDKNEIAEVRVGTNSANHPNGIEGAYELLRLVSYGCIFATNKDMSKSEIAELFKNTCINEGSVNKNNGVEYYALGTDEVMSFIITVDEELFIG